MDYLRCDDVQGLETAAREYLGQHFLPPSWTDATRELRCVPLHVPAALDFLVWWLEEGQRCHHKQIAAVEARIRYQCPRPGSIGNPKLPRDQVMQFTPDNDACTHCYHCGESIDDHGTDEVNDSICPECSGTGWLRPKVPHARDFRPYPEALAECVLRVACGEGPLVGVLGEWESEGDVRVRWALDKSTYFVVASRHWAGVGRDGRTIARGPETGLAGQAACDRAAMERALWLVGGPVAL